MKYLIQKHSNATILSVVGELIANGHGTYRPRLKADDFRDAIVIQGSKYRVSVRWPDGAEIHELDATIIPKGETDERDSI